MSMADCVSQMQAIQARFEQLGFIRSSTTAATSSTGATAFASALDGANASSGATATTSTTASSAGGLVSPDGVTGDDVVAAAKSYVGTPYVLGGESKSGIDCSGLVQAAFKQVGVSVPRLVHQQETVGQEVPSLKDAKPGDLIVLNGGDHIAIWLGHDTVLHAPYAGRTVSVQKAWFSDKDVTTIRRVVPATGDSGAATTGGTASAVGGMSSTGLSSATVARATAMLGMYGATDGSDDSSDSGSSGSSLSSLLSSFGITGTSGASGTSSAQQLIAAQSALLGTSD